MSDKTCNELAPPDDRVRDPLPSLCSLPMGHEGDHEEHLGGRVCRRWPAKQSIAALVADLRAKATSADARMVSRDDLLRLCAALESEYRRGIEDAAKVAETEPEPLEDPEPFVRHAMEAFGAVSIGVSAVRVTKRNIASRIRALADGGRDE